ncbi:hypothetical protein PDIP_86410 [Penicillium digitatum Pd1]|uniref:3-hydroxyacyl-CoA dehydrogenase C-terminal domain-containing protein n=1 Tax=Penicillium digitatum (strain Pd1 / CECT 20795) TaxID=1170230 RepID=K9F5N9_PEND1|nr:hypothetical protein PDIP_86410 [Penicillium digitatum Pd1]EKV04670.1 hypothetical protein PDIP_86410 [Penicillium digitatum Pd1]
MVELMTYGRTDPEIFPWKLSGRGGGGGMRHVTSDSSPRLHRVKREIMQILSEGVSDPGEIDLLWENSFRNSPLPYQLMDQVGLDTVAFIEENYIQEMGLPSAPTVDWLRKE